jgi:hypothetical protein
LGWSRCAVDCLVAGFAHLCGEVELAGVRAACVCGPLLWSIYIYGWNGKVEFCWGCFVEWGALLVFYGWGGEGLLWSVSIKLVV